jgi:hypothetical protein
MKYPYKNKYISPGCFISALKMEYLFVFTNKNFFSSLRGELRKEKTFAGQVVP